MWSQIRAKLQLSIYMLLTLFAISNIPLKGMQTRKCFQLGAVPSSTMKLVTILLKYCSVWLQNYSRIIVSLKSVIISVKYRAGLFFALI